MRAAERLAAGMDRQLKAGELLLSELIRSGIASPPAPAPQPVPAQPGVPDPKAMVAAAQAFANRTRNRARERTDGLAA
jgi:hypothetical protein